MRKALTQTFIALALLISVLALPLAVRPATAEATVTERASSAASLR